MILYRISGGYADRVVVDATAAVPKPPAMSFEEGSRIDADRSDRSPHADRDGRR